MSRSDFAPYTEPMPGSDGLLAENPGDAWSPGFDGFTGTRSSLHRQQRPDRLGVEGEPLQGAISRELRDGAEAGGALVGVCHVQVPSFLGRFLEKRGVIGCRPRSETARTG